MNRLRIMRAATVLGVDAPVTHGAIAVALAAAVGFAPASAFSQQSLSAVDCSSVAGTPQLHAADGARTIPSGEAMEAARIQPALHVTQIVERDRAGTGSGRSAALSAAATAASAIAAMSLLLGLGGRGMSAFRRRRLPPSGNP